MNYFLKTILGIFVLISCNGVISKAQSQWNEINIKNAVSVDTIVNRRLTLIFISNDKSFDSTMKKRMTGAFFTVYPKEIKAYNIASLKKVIMIIDTAYKGVAATDNGIVRINPEWMQKHPEDIDVVTHEVMHIVQSYPDDAGPGWITEGIADYARYQFGINNDAGHWSLPDYKSTQSYENAYRVTARFFLWIETKRSKGLVKKLDNAMRTKTYTAAFWQQATGKTVDELWKEYSADPAIGNL